MSDKYPELIRPWLAAPSTPLAEVAISLGVPCFPCNAEKRPLTAHGFKDASTDPAVIRALFNRADAVLIGVPTGPESGWYVVDIDIKAGAQGMAWLDMHASDLVSTRTHKTRSGGLHLVFTLPDGVEVRNSASRLGPGVDVRGDGGYVIVPPSPGYSIADSASPAPMPEWLIRACGRELTPPPSPTQVPRQHASSIGTPYGLGALDRACDAIRNAAEGTKHEVLNREAYGIGGLIQEGHLLESVALAALSSALADIRPRCRDFRAAEQTLRTAFRDGLSKPRAVPERPPMAMDGELVGGEFIAKLKTTAKQAAPAEAVARASRKARLPAPEAPSNIAPELYTGLPGVAGIMHDWILRTSAKPQPALALGAVLAFMGSAVGQRVKLERWSTRPNLYVLAVAHSGAGKERPMSACKQMATAAGLFADLIGVEDVASDAGIVTSVCRAPRQIMLVDEVSYVLAATSNRNAGAYLQNVNSTLLKLYSSSHTKFQSKAYADFQKVRVVDQPCVSFYGSCTPSGLTDALTAKDITSGLLSRMVIFDAGDRDPRVTPPSAEPVPDAVVDWLVAWAKVAPNPNPIALIGGEPVIDPRPVRMTDEAAAIAMEFEGEMHAAKIAARARGTDALYVRALENALKFALLRGCAVPPVQSDAGPKIDLSALQVDAETMRWAVELSRATVKRMDETTGEIADGPYQQAVKALRQFIRRAGERGASVRDISKSAAGKHPQNRQASAEDAERSIRVPHDGRRRVPGREHADRRATP